MSLISQDRGFEPEEGIVLTHAVEKEGKQFVSFCPELGTTSCGDTIEEALSNLEEAIEVHLNALEEIGERERVFEEKNITIEPFDSPLQEGVKVNYPTAGIAGVNLPLGTLMRAAPHKIPAGI